ncbi:hypothetical protein V6N13_109354 [Hibiscus sabdariffa]
MFRSTPVPIPVAITSQSSASIVFTKEAAIMPSIEESASLSATQPQEQHSHPTLVPNDGQDEMPQPSQEEVVYRVDPTSRIEPKHHLSCMDNQGS